MIIHTITLDCDRCGWEYDASSASSAELRDWAKADGWKVNQPSGTDICRKCVRELPDEEFDLARRIASNKR